MSRERPPARRCQALWGVAVALGSAAALGASAPARAAGSLIETAPRSIEPAGAAAPADSAQVPRSLRGRLIALLSDYVVAQPPDSLPRRLVPAEEAFRDHQGKLIRKIEIEQLDMFSGMPGSSDRPADGALERWARRLHRRTRRAIIRQHLLMKEGDPLDPYTLADTERLLRSTAFLQDARIAVLPVPGEEARVDLLVVTRDVWSIGFSLPVDRADELRPRVFERNLLGLGQDVEYRLWVATSTLERTQWEARYRIGNILGTFLGTSLVLGDQEEERWQRVSLGRSPIAPQIRLAGGVTFENISRKDRADEYPGRYRERFQRIDAHLGYNLALGRNEAGGPGRVALFPALRCTWTDMRTRPAVDWPLSLRYQDRTLVLGGVQLGRHEYRQTRLVRAYGETEDIAVGYRLGLAAGRELGDAADRSYVAVLAGGFGDVALSWAAGGTVEFGTYRRNSAWEDGVLQTHLGGFSGLGTIGRFRLRHFADLLHTAGIRRLAKDERLLLDRRTGLRGLRDAQLAGRQRAVLNLESVAFTPWSPLGFKIATYAFCDIGAVAPDLADFARSRYYECFGLGVRLRNERLVFDTVDLQIAFMPAPPANSDVQPVRFRNPPSSPVDRWQLGPPGVVEHR